jgi:molybdate transport system substrate-binding protein
VAEGTRVAFLSNRLVVVAPRDGGPAIHGPADLAAPAIARLSLADPDAVPAGKYAKAWLARSGVWEAVKDRVLPGVDVRAALAAVESGGAQAGVVYATDAALSSRVKVVYEVPVAEGPRITYAAAAIAGRPFLDRSRALLACLEEDRSREVFRRYGFLDPGP